MFYRYLIAGAIGCACPTAFAQATLADFESGLPIGWSTSGSAWTFGGATATSPNVLPPQGAQFARSGAPNVVSGALAESLTGTLTSKGFIVSYDTLQWLAAGWSGQFNNGLSRFEILDQSFAVKATVSAPLTDSWVTQSVNLLSSGLSAGSTFYFRAVDGNFANNYSWLAADNLHLVGAPVPEVGAQLLMLCGGTLITLAIRRRKRNP